MAALELGDNLPAVFKCVLHGILPNDKQLVPFVHKLKEVCEAPGDAVHRFVRYECVYTQGPQLSGSPVATVSPKQIRVRTLLDPSQPDLASPDLNWMLHVSGAQRWEKDFPCVVREHKTIPVSPGYHELLSFLGYKVDFQFVEKGYRFMHPLGIEITVFKPVKMQVPGDLKSLKDLAHAHWMVKMQALCDLRLLSSVPHSLRQFADQFRSFVTMERVDLGDRPQIQVQRA